MLNLQKTLEREAMLKRIRGLDAAIAQHERNLREGEARLSLEEQLRLKLRRFIEATIPGGENRYNLAALGIGDSRSGCLHALISDFTLNYYFQVLVGMQS